MTTVCLPWPNRDLHPNDGQLCSIEGCDNPSKTRGWCKKHYARWLRYGDPNYTKKTPNGEPLRFLFETALQHQSDDCLLWPYNKTGDGYPVLRYKGRVKKGHRLLCAAAHGEQPSAERREVAHGCGNPACVNPRHLRWATPKENQADKIAHGTTNRGERQWGSKLTAKDVLEIRALKGKVSRGVIAKRYGVGRPAIDKIHWGQRWAWL